jgi:hypothetical protein
MEAETDILDLKGLNPETGKAPEARVSSVAAARSIYTNIKTADESSSKNRALIDGMFNGNPPFRQSDLEEMGQGERTNLDFGEAAALKEQALAGYYDLTSSVDRFATVQLDAGTAEQRAEWSQVVSEEFHRTLREWQEFEFNHQRLCDQFVSHGVGITYFEDAIDWRWRVAGLSEFRVPRGTKANEWEIEVAVIDREYLAHQLYKHIKDPETATRLGWNVKMARQALIKACVETPVNDTTDWEKLEIELKNNDLTYGSNSRSKKIEVVHMWVREFDGKVSHLMFSKTGVDSDTNGKPEDFLFKKVGRFESPTSCYITFCYGVGNGTLHSIRGLGYKIYPHVQLLNRLRCGMVDGALLSSALVVQPADNGSRALEDLTLSYYGPYALFPPGLKIVDKAIPDYSRNVMPVLNDITMNMQNRTLGFQSRAVTPDGQARTAYEVKAQLQQEAVLSASSINLFYHPWKRLLREVYRRLSAPDYSADLPGGREAQEFRRRCIKRNVPGDVLHKFLSVEPVRAIGLGSPGMRQTAIDETMAILGALDEAGRINLLRDRIAARFGQEVVDRYLPSANTALRPPVDDKIALLENSAMATGSPLPVSAGENHFIHASRHLSAMDAIEQGVTQGADPAKALTALQTILPHLAQHIESMNGDETRKDQVALMRQRLQQLAASAQRLQDELQAQAENEAKAQQAEQQRALEAEQARVAEMERQLAESTMASPKLQQEIAERRAKLEMDIEKHKVELSLKQARVTQDLLLKDAQSAAKVRSAATSETQPIVAQ